MDIVNWPVAAIIMFAILVSCFYRPIYDLLSRVKTIGRDGLSTHDHPSKEKQSEQKVDDLIKKSTQTVDTEAHQVAIAEIMEDLNTHAFENEQDKTIFLVRQLAKARLFLQCEIIYRNIFGSQIAFLKVINTKMMESADLDNFYQSVQKMHSDQFANFKQDQYYGYIINNNLIAFDNGIYGISKLGREFLHWLVDSGVDETPPL